MLSLILLSFVGLALSAPTVDISSTTVRPLGNGLVNNMLPSIPNLPNSNLPVNNVVNQLPVTGNLNVPLFNGTLPLLPFVHPPITGSFPWWFFIQQPQFLQLYHYWLIQQHPWWNLGLNGFANNWMLQNLGLMNLNNFNGQFSGLPNSLYNFNNFNLPVHNIPDVINGRGTPIPYMNQKLFSPPYMGQTLNTGTVNRSPLTTFKLSTTGLPMKHDIMYYPSYQNQFYNYPYTYGQYPNYYQYGQYPYYQSQYPYYQYPYYQYPYGQYPSVQPLTGGNIVVDQPNIATATNVVSTPTDQVNVQSQPIIQPTVV